MTEHTCSKQNYKEEVSYSCRYLQENTAQTEEEFKNVDYFLQNELHSWFIRSVLFHYQLFTDKSARKKTLKAELFR